jgi:hypothetical protein
MIRLYKPTAKMNPASWIAGFHSGDYKEFYLLRYNAMLCVENQPMFYRNMLTPSSGLKDKPSKKAA